MVKSHIPIENFLANLSMFGQLDESAIERLAAGTTEVDAPRETLIFRRGDPCTGLYLLVFGQAKLSLETNRGDEKVVELIGPGMSFGEAAMFLEKPYLVTAETLTDSKLLHVVKDVVLNEVRGNPDFSQRVIEVISRHLYQGIVDLESYTLHSGTERVVDFLLNHELHTRFNGELRLTLPAKKGIIASRLNLTHEHFSRILHDLMSERLIEVDGRQVCISDIGRLREYCAG